VALGAACSAIFLAVVLYYRDLRSRLLRKPAVVAALVMYSVAVFSVAYAVCSLVQRGSVQTDGTAIPHTLGVAALLASGLGIAGGEVGAHVQNDARIVAELQLLLVVGAVAGVGAQVAKRLSGEAPPTVAPRPLTPTLELYERVYRRLSDREGDTVLAERQITEPATRLRLKSLIADLPAPAVATEGDAVRTFELINAGELEYFYPLPFGERSLGETVRAWLHDQVS
jgi:hypothetical protein